MWWPGTLRDQRGYWKWIGEGRAGDWDGRHRTAEDGEDYWPWQFWMESRPERGEQDQAGPGWDVLEWDLGIGQWYLHKFEPDW